jgi:adenosylcobinamide kinase/adenosylcobinamide-phosphate guanylyltransferase
VDKRLLFVLGGTRSGKSSYGLHLAKQAGGRVLYVATADTGDGDEEMERRIAGHRRARPLEWETLEVGTDLPMALEAVVDRYDTVLLDGLTLWVSRLVVELEEEGAGRVEETVLEETRKLLALYERGQAAWTVVSDEVGLGVVPATPLGRIFRDALGRVHQMLAARADEVYLTVAGYALPLKALGAERVPDPFGDGQAP